MISRIYSILVHLAQDVRSLWRIPALPYSFGERVGLVLARRSHQQQARILHFRVGRLDETSYKHVLSEIFFLGEYRFEAASETPVILDCGANIGLATLFFKYIYPKARIKTFEADPRNAAMLRANVEANELQDVSVYNLMLAGSEGVHSFYTDSGVGGTLKASAEPLRFSNSHEIFVQAAKLSNFIDGPVDLLKLDVEGCEFEVLDDLRRTGKLSHIRQMVIEYHHKMGGKQSQLSKFLAQLEEEGFEYQIAAAGCEPITRRNVYQDVILGVYRP